MPISTEYRLPGVYTHETTGPRLNTSIAGNAVVALVGPSIGYLTASQRVVMSGDEEYRLGNPGVISENGQIAVTATNAATGQKLVQGEDFEVRVDYEGNAYVKRHVKKSSLEAKQAGVETTFYSAQPTIDLLALAREVGTGALVGEEGVYKGMHIVNGKLSASAELAAEPSALSGDGAGRAEPEERVTLQEGTDFVVDYHTGEFTAKLGTKLQNGCKLTVGFYVTEAEPVELVGEAAYPLSRKFIDRGGVTYDLAAPIEPDRASQYAPDPSKNEVEAPVSLVLVSGLATDPTYGPTAFGQCPGIEGQYYVEGADYTVDYQNGRIARLDGSRIPAFEESAGNYMYASYGSCAIRDDDPVVFTYAYKPSDYDSPHWFNSYNELMDYYGQPWNTSTGEVLSPITVAAYVAARNGMAGCYAVSVPATYNVSGTGTSATYTIAAWERALDALTVIDGIDIVVPLTGDRSIWDAARAHKNTMADNEDERICILSADGTQSSIGQDEMIGYANYLSDEDLWLVGPSTFRFRNPITGVVEVVPGWYMAAAVAGYEASVPQYTPLTHKNMTGLYSANEYATKVAKRNQCANGVMYVDEYNSQMRVLHGRTTSTTSIIEQEANIVLTKYYIIKTLRRNFAVGYIGSPITRDTLLNIKSTAQSVLSMLVNGNYMTSFKSLVVEQDGTNPTQVNISFEYVPTYSLNYIYISFSIDQTTTLGSV